VMPHAIYLHSALVPAGAGAGTPRQRRAALSAQRTDVLAAMGLAGLVNAIMLVVAAVLFHPATAVGTNSLAEVHAGFSRTLDSTAATVFALALLASGFASASVGTYSGQVILQGFLHRTVPLLARRVLTLAPALGVLALGVDPTAALVISQVVLSFGIPFALIPLVLLTRRRDVMAELVNRRSTTMWAAAVAAVIVVLNGVLVVSLFSA
jgi:manganese transport protein